MSPESLQFDRVEPASQKSQVATCVGCRRPIIQSYYELNGKLICPECRESVERSGQGSALARVGLAFGAGLGVAILGAVLWWGVRKLTGYEVGIVSIAIGYGVGKAVRWGSRRRGGWAYQ